jgi:hypothetical protein
MKTINSVAMLMAILVSSTPNLTRPIATSTAAITKAQCEPIHLASH